MAREVATRRGELARLARLLDDTGPDTIVLSGEAGVGKTHLARALGEVARARGRDVEWCVATEAAAGIPFGALAHLLPVPEAGPGVGLPYLQRALAALRERAERGRFLLVVDDAHLLDPAAATLVHRLALERVAPLLLTVRAGEPAADAVLRLARDEADQLQIDPLDQQQTARLLEAMLDGPATERLRANVWRMTRGNPLYLKELLADARHAGEVVRWAELWDVPTELAPGRRLSDLIGRRLRRLNDAEREALEMLALGEPLETDVLTRTVTPDVLETLTRRGFVVARTADRREVVELSHPVYGEVLRAQLPSPTRRRIRGLLADAVEASGVRRRGDLLRLASLRLDDPSADDPSLLTAAARRAHATFDHELAERLARRAIQSATEPAAVVQAKLVLAEALSHQLRIGDADAAFADAVAAALDPAGRVHVTLARAEHLFFRGEQAETAISLLRSELERTDDEHAEDLLRALLATFAAVLGDLRTASAAGERILQRDDASPDAVVRTLFVSTLADAMLGRPARAHEGVFVGLDRVRDVLDAVPLADDILRVNDVVAHAYAGALHRAEQLALDGRRDAIAAGRLDAAGVWSWLVAEVLALRGSIGDARRVVAEALPILAQRDPLAIRPSLVVISVMLAAMGGDQDGGALRREFELASRIPEARVATLSARTRAWLALGRGRQAAADGAIHAAEVAERHTQLVWAALAYHDAVRFGAGDPVADRLERLAAAMDTELVAALATHARAWVQRDAPRLEGVSRQFERIGADLYAASAVAQAAQVLADTNRRRARRATSRARVLADRCVGARTPLLEGIGGERLTPRQVEVADLARRGMTSPEIAERLTLSSRTVDNYLGAVYRKLGVSSRDELRFVLGASSAENGRTGGLPPG